MACFDWDKSLATNVREFDSQHRRLLTIRNQLHEAMKERKGKEAISHLLTELDRHTVTHVTAEEKGIAEVNYPGLPQQVAQHKVSAAGIAEYRLLQHQGKTVTSMDVMNFLKDWLTNDIQKMDLGYGPYFQTGETQSGPAGDRPGQKEPVAR